MRFCLDYLVESTSGLVLFFVFVRGGLKPWANVLHTGAIVSGSEILWATRSVGKAIMHTYLGLHWVCPLRIKCSFGRRPVMKQPRPFVNRVPNLLFNPRIIPARDETRGKYTSWHRCAFASDVVVVVLGGCTSCQFRPDCGGHINPYATLVHVSAWRPTSDDRSMYATSRYPV